MDFMQFTEGCIWLALICLAYIEDFVLAAESLHPLCTLLFWPLNNLLIGLCCQGNASANVTEENTHRLLRRSVSSLQPELNMSSVVSVAQENIGAIKTVRNVTPLDCMSVFGHVFPILSVWLVLVGPCSCESIYAVQCYWCSNSADKDIIHNPFDKRNEQTTIDKGTNKTSF